VGASGRARAGDVPAGAGRQGRPADRARWIDGPDVEEIVAANYDNPIRSNGRATSSRENTEAEIKLQHVNEADTRRPVGSRRSSICASLWCSRRARPVLIIYQRDHLVRRG
jgi:hypothetical protein